MRPEFILGIVAVAISPLTILGMVLDDADYWLGMDIAVILILPATGFALMRLARLR